MPGLGQGLLVDVGGVDLDPLAEPSCPSASARTIASVYASSPEAQPALQTRIGSSGRLRLEQPRDDLLGEVLPGRRVAEEGGHVDQDRVEEGANSSGWTSR